MKNGSDFPDNQYRITEWPNGGNCIIRAPSYAVRITKWYSVDNGFIHSHDTVKVKSSRRIYHDERKNI